MRFFGVAVFSLFFSFTSLANDKLLKTFEEGDAAALKEMLAQGAYVNQRNDNGEPLLSIAVWTYQMEKTIALLQYKANPNLGDKTGSTPLFHAVTKRDVEAVKLLLQYGADVNQKNKYSIGPLSNALTYTNDAEMVKLLLSNGAHYDSYQVQPITKLLGESPEEYLKHAKFDVTFTETLKRLENILDRNGKLEKAKELLDQLAKL